MIRFTPKQILPQQLVFDRQKLFFPIHTELQHRWASDRSYLIYIRSFVHPFIIITIEVSVGFSMDTDAELVS